MRENSDHAGTSFTCSEPLTLIMVNHVNCNSLINPTVGMSSAMARSAWAGRPCGTVEAAMNNGAQMARRQRLFRARRNDLAWQIGNLKYYPPAFGYTPVDNDYANN